MVKDYPRDPLRDAVRTATHYGLYDLERVEHMLLRALAHDFFFVIPDEVNTREDVARTSHADVAEPVPAPEDSHD